MTQNRSVRKNGVERQDIGVTGRRNWGRLWTGDGPKRHGKKKKKKKKKKEELNKFKWYGFL